MIPLSAGSLEVDILGMVRAKYRKSKKKPSFARKILFRLIWPVFLLGSLGAMIFFFFGTSRFDPSDIKVEGARRVNAEEVIAVVRPFFEDNKLGFFSGNVFIFNRSGAASRLTEFFPRISGVDFKINIQSRELTIIINERNKSAAIWCSVMPLPDVADIINNEQQSTCFNIDEEAFAFEEALQTQGTLLLTIRNERSNQELKQIGERVAEESFLKKMLYIRDALKETSQLGISAVLLKDPDEVVAQTLENWNIIFVDSRPIEDQVTALREILKSQIPIEKRKQLEYIDLRVEERAYYKYR